MSAATLERGDQPQVTSHDVMVVEGLTIDSPSVTLVHNVSFTLRRGERVGLIGESGSGKSLTSLALMGLLPEGVTASGSVRLAGSTQNLLSTPEKTLSGIRGKELAMVFQEPMTSLNPLMRVGAQVVEAVRQHTQTSRRAAKAAAVDLLTRVRLPDPEYAMRAYPHELSGGQRQRIVLAMAMANDPLLLLCDEPTTALDVTVQAQMLQLIRAAVVENDSALLFITHDLAVVAEVCERVMVMYGGRIVESGTVEQVFRHPEHPYTAGLLAASDLQTDDGTGRFATIPGTVPAAGQFPSGCVFRNRCHRATDICATKPQWDTDRGVACWHPMSEGLETA